MINLMPTLIALIVAAAALGTAGIVFIKDRRSLKNTPPPPAASGPTLDQIPQSSYNALNSAIKKAQNILSQAELEAVDLVATTRHSTTELENKYSQEFADSTKRVEGVFSEEIAAAEKEYIKYLQTLEAHGKQTTDLLLNSTQQKTTEFFDRFEQNLTSFLTQTQQQSLDAINLEMRAARQLIDTYKVQQLNLIDENIVAILERTLSLVLSQKMTLSEHTDLVYESLEKAKAEKFIL
jgi:hypothetical protein